MSDWLVRVDGTVIEKAEIRSIRWGYAFPRECELFFPGAHDVGIAQLTNNNIVDVSNDDFTTLVFRGALELNNPQGVRREGVTYNVKGLEHLANRYIVKFNGSVDYSYNLSNLPDYHAPSAWWSGGWGRWKVGEIMIDILEHAGGLPVGGSAIPLHHPTGFSVTNTYMPSSVLNSYSVAMMETLDLVVGEVRVTAQKFWDFMQHLVQLMDHHGIFIDPSDPSNPTLVVHDYSTSTSVNFYCGHDHGHVDNMGSGSDCPLVVDSDVRLNIEPCKTRIIIEGRGKVLELIPQTQGGVLNGTMIPNWPDDAAKKGQHWIIWDPQTFTPFWAGVLSCGIYGPVMVVDGVVCHEGFANWNLDLGTAVTQVDLRGHTVEVWTYYLAPFQVTAGPGGTAYDDHGLIAEEAVHDGTLLHPSHMYGVPYNHIGTYQPGTYYDCSYPYNQEFTSGEYNSVWHTRDDTTMMQAIANAMLARLGDERVECRITLDGIDLSAYTLRKVGNFSGLQKWSSINVQIIEISVNPVNDEMICRLSNDVFRVPGYAEWKRRFLLRNDVRVLQRSLEVVANTVVSNIIGATKFPRRMMP